MKRLINFIKKCNKGSTMVTVIIVVAFMSILGTIALYISGQNYKMKVIDSSNKRSFYEAEEVVELLKTQLTVDVATAAQRATKAAGANYVEEDNVAIREEMYLKNFQTEFEKVWNYHFDDHSGVMGADPINSTQAINDLFGGSTYTITDVQVNGAEWSFKININGETLFCEINDMGDSFKYKSALEKPTSLLVPSKVDSSKNIPASYKINDFNITVTDSKGYVSVIKTTFEITPPSLNWDSSTSLKGEEADPTTNPLGIISKADYSDSVLYVNWCKE